jgi:large subunit ribosomal protein L28
MVWDANLCVVPPAEPADPRRIWHMAAVCDLCGKKPSFGMSLSHSHRRTKRRWDPNIQRVRALVDGTPVRLHVCTSCIRSGKVVKPPRREVPVSS